MTAYDDVLEAWGASVVSFQDGTSTEQPGMNALFRRQKRLNPRTVSPGV
jgi:hypothetical protein